MNEFNHLDRVEHEKRGRGKVIAPPAPDPYWRDRSYIAVLYDDDPNGSPKWTKPSNLTKIEGVDE